IMDEPFVGLDPNGVKILISSLKNWVKNKRISLLISSHQLNELEEVCDRFVMLKEGKLHSIELDKHVSFKIVLNINVTQADTLSYIEFFPIINKIEDNIIYINKEGDDYNGLMQKILEKYNLVSIENTEEDLYHIFNHFENKEDDYMLVINIILNISSRTSAKIFFAIALYPLLYLITLFLPTNFMLVGGVNNGLSGLDFYCGILLAHSQFAIPLIMMSYFVSLLFYEEYSSGKLIFYKDIKRTKLLNTKLFTLITIYTIYFFILFIVSEVLY